MRRIISILMLVCFLSLATTGLVLLLSDEKGERSRDRQTLSQISSGVPVSVAQEKPAKRFFPKEMHEMTAVIFIFVACTHLVLNRRAVLKYLGMG